MINLPLKFFHEPLLKKIKRAIPVTVIRHQKQLYAKLQQGVISEKEREELSLLNDILEEKSAERILYLGELSKLKGISIRQLVSELNIKPSHA